MLKLSITLLIIYSIFRVDQLFVGVKSQDILLQGQGLTM